VKVCSQAMPRMLFVCVCGARQSSAMHGITLRGMNGWLPQQFQQLQLQANKRFRASNQQANTLSVKTTPTHYKHGLFQVLQEPVRFGHHYSPIFDERAAPCTSHQDDARPGSRDAPQEGNA
ncbi:hypothetical protein EDD21DRAFT_377844, partial [Dissophora ornata]